MGTGDRSQIAMRYALDRLRKLEFDADDFSRRWQDALRQCEAVQQKLTAIEKSDEYKSWRRLCQLFGPPGSRRRRFSAACFRAARRLFCSLPFCAGSSRVADSHPSLPQTVGEANEGAMATVDQPLAASGPQEARPLPTTPRELAYSPTSWRLSNATADAEFLDLLVLSPVHRTGSTLLQRICNSRKGTLIWGEHGGVLKLFASIFRNAALFSMAGEMERKEYFAQDENPNLWIANMCPELECVQQAVVNSARTLINTLYGRYRKDHDILGFKEVQYRRAELELLRRCYPRAHFLLLVRNPLDAWRSTPTDWYSSLEDWIATYNDGVLGYHAFARNDANCHILRYEDLVRQDGKVMAVIAEVAKVPREQAATVLAHKIGGHRSSLSDRDRDVILRDCRESMQMLDYRTVPERAQVCL
jgi:hypothetical protein